jgi:hypothetical protein
MIATGGDLTIGGTAKFGQGRILRAGNCGKKE